MSLHTFLLKRGHRVSFSPLNAEKLAALCLFSFANVGFFGFLGAVANKEMIHSCLILHNSGRKKAFGTMMPQTSNAFALMTVSPRSLQLVVNP